MKSMTENLNGAVENCRTLLWHKDLRARTRRKAQDRHWGISIGSPHRFLAFREINARVGDPTDTLLL